MKCSLRKKRTRLPEPVVEYCEVAMTKETQEGIDRAFSKLFEEVVRRRRLPTTNMPHLEHNVFVETFNK
jgi:hypothetical protein